MSNATEFFLSVTQRVFSNWTALRMAVEHGMGPKERAVDFCPYMTEVMYMNGNGLACRPVFIGFTHLFTNRSWDTVDKLCEEVCCFVEQKNLDNSQVANELENYMDEHFNTELHDDSAMQVAEELLRFHRYCTENNEGLAVAELEKLPPLQPWIVTNEPVRRTQSRSIVEEDSSEGEEESTKDMEVADEWTEVKSRRKR